jgi:hypothetical protein
LLLVELEHPGSLPLLDPRGSLGRESWLLVSGGDGVSAPEGVNGQHRIELVARLEVSARAGVSIFKNAIVRLLEGATMNALELLVERNCRRAELQALIAINRTGRGHPPGTKRYDDAHG